MAISITVYPELSPRIIEVTAPETEATVQEIVDAIRAWEDMTVNMGYPFLIQAVGKEDLGSGLFVGITATLQNARIMFEGRAEELDEGTATSIDTLGTVLTDSTATFIADGLAYVGCTLFNHTTEGMSVITEIVSETEIRTFPLKGGDVRNDWQIGDSYQIYPNVQCNIGGGNLVAIDTTGSAISAVAQSPNVQIILENATSAALLSSSSSSPWDEDITTHQTANSAGAELTTAKQQAILAASLSA